MGVAAVAAGVGAVGSIAGGLISSSGAQSAASTQAAAANQASQNAMAQYAQTRADLAPYNTAGQGALSILSNILGIGGGSATAPTVAGGGAPASGGGGAQSSSGGTALWQLNDNQLSVPKGGTGTITGPNGEPIYTIPQGYTLQDSVNSASDGPSNAQGWVLTDAAGNIIQSGGAGGTLTSFLGKLGQLGAPVAGAGSSASAPPAPAPTPTSTATPTPGSALSSYGLPGLTFQPTQAQLEQTPGYQFDLSQGLQGVANSNAAAGRGISGAALKGAAGYATGLANNTLTTQQGIFQQNLGNVLNPLEWAANLGQNSAATTGQQGISAIGNANNALVGGANASAAGTVGAANALSSGLSGLGNSATNYLLFNNLLNGGAGGMLGSGGFTSGGTYT